MDFIFKEWQKAIEKLQSSLEKDVEEVRRQKEEVQAMKKDIFSQISAGQYIRDEHRIVISAPEIIIGNVDKSGDLWGNGPFSNVIIRSNDVNIEGVGRSGNELGGSIVNRASSIRNIAVDPGMDGLENVVRANSEIINHARSIVIQANDDDNVFSQAVTTPSSGGVILHADKAMTIEASVANDSHTKQIEDQKKGLKQRQSDLKKSVSEGKSEVSGIISDIEKKLNETEDKNDTADHLFANTATLLEIQYDYERLTMSLYDAMTEYLHNLAELAEVNRTLSALEETGKKLSTAKSKYKKESTGAVISMNSEVIKLASTDGDGNIRETDGSGVSIDGRNIRLSTQKRDGSLIGNSLIAFNSENIFASTANAAFTDSKVDCPATGNIRVTSKDILLESVDYESDKKTVKEKALTKDGRISLRAENVDVCTNDTDGKATGEVNINAKAIGIKSMDVDKESREEKELAKESTMVLVSEKIFAGGLEKDKNKSKNVQITSESIGIIAKTTAEIQQDKATVQLDGGKFSAGGDKTQLFGDTTINGKTEMKGDVKAPKLTADNLEAKSSFKSTNISDGIAVPGAGAPGKLSAKIKEEAAPKPKPKPKKEQKK